MELVLCVVCIDTCKKECHVGASDGGAGSASAAERLRDPLSAAAAYRIAAPVTPSTATSGHCSPRRVCHSLASLAALRVSALPAARARSRRNSSLPRVSPAALRRVRRQRSWSRKRTACAPPRPSLWPTTPQPLCQVAPAPPPPARAAARFPPRSCAAAHSGAGAQPRNRARGTHSARHAHAAAKSSRPPPPAPRLAARSDASYEARLPGSRSASYARCTSLKSLPSALVGSTCRSGCVAFARARKAALICAALASGLTCSTS